LPGAWHKHRYTTNNHFLWSDLSGFPLIKNKEFLRINVISAIRCRFVSELEDADSEVARKWTEAGNKLTFGCSSKKNLQLKIPV